MFGLIVSGRPVVTEAVTISPTSLAFTLPSSPAFNHLVVFTLPGNALPEGQCAAVYIQVTPSSEFRLLGALSSAKPSAIFRTRLESSTGSSVGFGAVDEDAMMDSVGAASVNVAGSITIGISLEPAAQVEQNLAAMKSSGQATSQTAMIKTGGAAGSVSTKILAQRIIGNAFNYLSSFGSDTISLKAFEEWWKKFERKIDLDPTFLERAES
jgi:hypothetical protein